MKYFELSEYIFSDESSNFVSNPLPSLNEEITIKIRMHKDTQPEDIYLIVWPHGEIFSYKMHKSETAGTFTYYSVKVKVSTLSFRYKFLIINGKKEYYYTLYGLYNFQVPETISFHIYADNDLSKWTPEAIFYQIFPDRFCKKGHIDVDRRKREWKNYIIKTNVRFTKKLYG